MTAVIIDDVIVTGVNDNDQIRNLLMRLSEYRLRVNKDKYSFLQPKVTFCGHKVSAEGIYQEESKTKAIKNASKLKSFLGRVNYFHKFIPNSAEILAPLYELTKTGVKWKWGTLKIKLLKKPKREIISYRVLTHYNPDLPLYIHTNASPQGLGCVMSHVMSDGQEKPLLFLSRAQRPAEKN